MKSAISIQIPLVSVCYFKTPKKCVSVDSTINFAHCAENDSILDEVTIVTRLTVKSKKPVAMLKQLISKKEIATKPIRTTQKLNTNDGKKEVE